jgi:hypothetical protein
VTLRLALLPLRVRLTFLDAPRLFHKGLTHVFACRGCIIEQRI